MEQFRNCTPFKSSKSRAYNCKLIIPLPKEFVCLLDINHHFVMGLGITVVRTGAIVILILVLCWQSFIALINLVDSPVGSKESLVLSEHTDYYPAISICPFPPPPLARSSMVSPEYTFTEGINNRSIKPKVLQSFYNVTK